LIRLPWFLDIVNWILYHYSHIQLPGFPVQEFIVLGVWGKATGRRAFLLTWLKYDQEIEGGGLLVSHEGTQSLVKELGGQAPVVHAYNPNYSGGRNQEDHRSKPAWANSS
jgi:hypothetical protein